MKDLLDKVSEKKGKQVQSFKEVEEDDLDEIEIEFQDPEAEENMVDLGSEYFTKYSVNMMEGVPPTKTAKNRDKFQEACLVAMYLNKFEDQYVVSESDHLF